MNETGYKNTRNDIKRFNTLLATEYKKSLDSIRADIQILYNKITEKYSPAQLGAILKDNPTFLYNESLKFDRLQALQKKIQTEYVKASIKAGSMTVEASKTAITNNFYAQQFALDFASPMKLSFTVLNPKVVEISVLGTPSVWNKIAKDVQDRISGKYGAIGNYQPKYGSLSSILTKNRKADLLKIQSSITQGLIKGQSYTKTAKDIKKILDSSATQALAVVRTESGRNQNAGQYASHNVALSQGLDIKRMALEVLDVVTRGQSQFIDGAYTDENDQFTYPGGLKVSIIGNSGVAKYDINERGVAIEVIDDMEPETRTGRNPLTGKNETMDFKSYPEWMDSKGFTQNATGRWVLR